MPTFLNSNEICNKWVDFAAIPLQINFSSAKDRERFLDLINTVSLAWNFFALLEDNDHILDFCSDSESLCQGQIIEIPWEFSNDRIRPHYSKSQIVNRLTNGMVKPIDSNKNYAYIAVPNSKDIYMEDLMSDLSPIFMGFEIGTDETIQNVIRAIESDYEYQESLYGFYDPFDRWWDKLAEVEGCVVNVPFTISEQEVSYQDEEEADTYVHSQFEFDFDKARVIFHG
jgi:hypothetical protein